MIRRCYENYYKFIKSYVPEKVEINRANDVVNTFEDGNVIDHKAKDEYWTPKKDDHKPLFFVSVSKSSQDNSIVYSTSPEFFKQTLVLTFSVTLDNF